MLKLRRSSRVVLVLALAAALGGGMPLGAAAPTRAVDMGTISGAVTDQTTGAPRPATIVVEDYASGEQVQALSTFADGTFGTMVPTGTYRIGASTPGYITEWYPESLDRENAQAVVVETSGSVSGINFTLEQGGTVSGTVFNEWGGTEQNQLVAVWRADTLEMVAWTFSNEFQDHGRYAIGDLPCGDYKVSAGGPLPEGVQDPGNRNDNLMRGWWNQQGTVASANEAAVVTVSSPTPIQAVNFNLQQGATLEGRVKDENWNGLNNATVTLENYDTGAAVAVATTYNRDGTDPGYYRFSGLSSAIGYRIRATASSRVIRYARMDTSGTYDVSLATRWQLQPGDWRWVNDISLPYGGSISGAIYQSDGSTPIVGAVVTVQSWEGMGGDSWVSVKTTTGAGGTYTVPGIPLGGYRVTALASGFTIEYYASGGSVADPGLTEQVTISPGLVNVTGIDFALDAGGMISGTVYNASQVPLAGCKVLALPVMVDPGAPAGGVDDGGDVSSPFAAETNASGAYTIIGLPFGDYNVQARGGANPQYVSEWYDNQLTPDSATSIAVTAEAASVAGIDFSLAIGGSITGVITPLGGEQWLNDPRVVVYDYDTGRKVASAGTLQDNTTYLVQGLPAGRYRVMATAWDRARVYWQATFSWNDAAPVQVNAPGVTSRINFALPPGGCMNGRVWLSQPDSPAVLLPGAIVTATMLNPLDTPDENFNDLRFTTVADDEGEWRLDFLPFGDYKIGARGGEGQIVIPRWWSDFGDARTWEEASVRSVDEFNRHWGCDFWLDPAGLITGSVFREDGTTPIAGAKVFASQMWFDGPPPPEGGDGMLGAATTEADGSYELFVPADRGSFIVGAQAEGRVRKFFQNTFDPETAIPFQVGWGEEQGGINFSLEAAGTISGTVYDADTGAELAGCAVVALDETTGVNFKAEVDENGAYTIDNLPYAEYIVMAMGRPDNPVTANYAMEWWQEAASFDAATPVAVAVDTPDVTGVNFTLEPGGAIEGMVWHEHGWDIQGALVSLYLPDGTLLATTRSNGWEGYRFCGVPSGSYKISAWFIDPQGNSNTQRMFYNSQKTFDEADLVEVNAPGIVSGIDFHLPQAAGRITGLLIYSGSLQSGDYAQVAVAAMPMESDGPEQMGYAISLPSLGTYELNNVADGTYIVIAWLDVDGDLQPDSGEPYGMYGDPTPVTIESTPENPWPQVPGTTIIITDEAKGVIMGRVALEGSEDYSGAVVSAGSYEVTTGADGAYILNVEPGTYTVTIARAGYLAAVSPQVYVVDVLGGEPTEMPDALLLLGDVNADASIDIADLVAVAEALGTPGPAGDVTGDGTVDILDLTAVGRNYGETGSPWLEAGTAGGYTQTGTPTVVLSPASQEAAPGDLVVVSATVKDASGIYGAEFHLTFDPALLQVQDADASIAGVQIAPSGDVFPFVPAAYHSGAGQALYHYSYSASTGGYFVARCAGDNTIGTIDYAIVLLAPATGTDNSVSASSAGGAVATITFDTLDEGEPSIDFTAGPKLADGSGAPISVDSFTGATATVQVPPPEISDIVVSNVGDKSFSVSWVTNVAVTGQINYGTSPDNLSSVAYDDRGEATGDDTHHVTVSGLAANTAYYFDIVSAQTTDDNSGAHYEVTTGPSLAFTMPEMVSGTVYQMDGTTPAGGVIIYAQIGTASSQVLSGVTDANGNWALDIAPARGADFQAYYAHADGDDLVIEGQGGAQGTASATTTVGTAKAGAPDLVLVPNWAPTVENVTASQEAGTGIVSIEYDVYDQDEDDTSVGVSFAFWNGVAYVACTSVTGDSTVSVSTSAAHYTATWNPRADFNGQYLTDARIKVIADDGNIAGTGEGLSAEFSLDTRGPTGVGPSSPADGATGVDLSPTFMAVAATDDSEPVSYNFVVARDQAFTTGVQESGWLSSPTWVPSTRLQAPEIAYWWKVKARDAFGNVTQSGVFTLTTLAVVPVDASLVDGWNIVALAIEPTEAYTASTLAADINAQGGTVSQVFWWNAPAGSWDFYLVDAQYGTNFNIEIGYGYLLKNAGTSTWTYWGVPPSADYSATVEPRVTNVADKSFTVSWISQAAEQGRVVYGISPGTLDQTAHDQRGETAQNDTHHVTVSGLTAGATYYFKVLSGGATYGSGGAPFEVTTGPSLAFTMPEMVSGQAFKADGTTPAEGAIVYVQIGTSSSQVLSSLADSSGNWALDIAPARTADFQSYYAHSDSDEITVQIQGAADGTGAQAVTIGTAKAGAPAATVSLAAELSLVDGWNLIALPVEPATAYTAGTMAADINGQGGSVSQVFWWNAAAGNWDFYLVDAQYGTNFSIEMGQGYLLKNSGPIKWAVPGN